jgi:hypothetical protein
VLFALKNYPEKELLEVDAKPPEWPKESRKEKVKKREGPLPKIFNMCTYKLHALGDYVASIWLYGTTDNYSTQVVSFINFSKTRNILIFNTQGELEY